MTVNVISAALAFIGGGVIAIINAVMTAKSLKKQDNKSMLLTVVRQFLNVAYLTAVFFIVRNMECNIAFPLFGAAIGLTVPSVIFAIYIAKNFSAEKKETDDSSEGGDC